MGYNNISTYRKIEYAEKLGGKVSENDTHPLFHLSSTTKNPN